jgi:hypothetical protein
VGEEMNGETARTRCPSHNGNSRTIREILANSPEPLSRDKIAMLTGLKPDRVGDALNQMVARTGRVVSLRGPRGVVYTLYEKRPQDAPEQALGQIGRGWYRPDFKELKRDPYEHMKLAMLARR